MSAATQPTSQAARTKGRPRKQGGDGTPLHWLTVRELGKRLRAGSLNPVGLAEHTLERLETLGPRFNAVVLVTQDLALRQARRAERELKAGRDRGPLHGIPYGVKDLLATRGLPTSWGFAGFRDRALDYDAAVIQKLNNAGAVLAAKLAMVELAGGLRYNQPDASFTGPGINPWEPGSWTGGSSSGSGAALAAGLVPFALGTETMGSITTPAAFCGASALRPGIGRVSNHGSMALAWTMDKIGPLCRTADDCGLVLDAIAGPHPADPHADPAPWHYAAGGKPRRKWRLCTIPGSDESNQPEVTRAFRASLRRLKAVADVEEKELPDYPYMEMAQTIAFAEAGAAFAEFRRRPELAAQLAAPESRGSAFTLPAISATAYIQALQLRQRIHRELTAWLAPFDAVISPTLKVVAPALGTRLSGYYAGNRRLPVTMIACLLGWPALTVPNGTGLRALPTGLMFVGKAGAENTVLALGRHVQQHTQWHLRHPKL